MSELGNFLLGSVSLQDAAVFVNSCWVAKNTARANMGWKVQLVGDATDLSALATSLTGPQIAVSHDGQDHLLSSDKFQDDDDTSTIHKKAQNIVTLLNGAARLKLKATKAIKASAVFRYTDDGTRKAAYLFPEPARLRTRAISPTVILKHADGTIEESHPADPIAEWLPVAINDEAVANLFKLLASSSLDWVDLYRAFEIITHDFGGIPSIHRAGWASEEKMKLFKRTANSPGAIGLQARHGASPDQPPPNPMRLYEARALINDIIHGWLDAKTRT